MAEHADPDGSEAPASPDADGADLGPEKLFLAAIGAVALGAERANELADQLAEKGGMRRDEARERAGKLGERWRGDASRLSERAGISLDGLFSELGLALREDYDELELRVAQLEHRLRLLEKKPEE